ncbi:MAG: diaminopimelate epimerase, partial [Candidatus Caldatribacteriaceae bacterium]
MHFVKMEGLGNDFIVVEKQEVAPYLPGISSLTVRLCDRHFGVGADGVIIVYESQKADVGMRIINADGSEAEMCGNGIRCLAKFVFERKMVNKTTFTVETKAGIIVPQVVIQNGRVESVIVNMGKPLLNPREIPVAMEKEDPLIQVPLDLGERVFRFTGVSMGNPHVVIFEIPSNWREWGKRIETHSLFPNRTNV